MGRAVRRGWGHISPPSVELRRVPQLAGVPTATHVVEYKERETRTKALVGKVAIEFSLENYGPGEWWLLLEPSPAAGGS